MAKAGVGEEAAESTPSAAQVGVAEVVAVEHQVAA